MVYFGSRHVVELVVCRSLLYQVRLEGVYAVWSRDAWDRSLLPIVVLLD